MSTTFPLNVPIISAVRTAVGRGIKGNLKNTRPDDMAATVMNGALKAAGNIDKADIADVILGCAMPEAEQGLNVARNAVFLAKWPDDIPGQTINRFCSSGLQAIADAAMAIQTGLADVVVAGGVESMSMVPMGGNKTSLNPELMENYPEAYISMGHTAERVAKKFEISRDMQDAFALNSQEKAKKAIAEGAFNDEIVSLSARVIKNGKIEWMDFNTDECPRDTTLEGLKGLRPVFSAKGSVTAGNSSPLSDGAAAAVLVSDKYLENKSLNAIARMRGFAVAGVPPDIMGIGPVPAIRKLLKQTGLGIEDIDLFEINEAFAAQASYCQRELNIEDTKINIYGGAIALGHPLGCTGAKLTATLVHALKRRGGKFGIVSMCIGGGMGAAGLFEV